MHRNRRISLRIVQIWAMPSWKDFDLLILKNCVWRLGNIHTLLVQPFYVVNFLILRNRVFRLRFVQIWAMPSWVLLRFADTQELCFEAWKRSYNACSDLLCGQFSVLRNRVFRLRNVQIWVVLSWKVVVRLIFTNSVFKQQNLQTWTMSKCKGFYLLIETSKR